MKIFKIITPLLISLFISQNAFANDNEQELYMNLHKAYNSLERNVRGDCKKGRRLAKKYLKRADKALSHLIAENKASELELPLQMLWEMRKNDDLTVFDVEGIRAEVQFVADKKKLLHNHEEWNNEIIDKCK